MIVPTQRSLDCHAALDSSWFKYVERLAMTGDKGNRIMNMSIKNKQIKTVITVIVLVIAIISITTGCSRNNDAVTSLGDSESEETLIVVPDLVGGSLDALKHEFEILGLIPSLYMLMSEEPIDTVLLIDRMGQHVSASTTIRVQISGGMTGREVEDADVHDPSAQQPDSGTEDTAGSGLLPEHWTQDTFDSIQERNELRRISFADIDWLVLDEDEEENKILILSEFVLFDKLYNDTFMPVTWEDSTIRSYLNNEFFNSFRPEERRRIAETRVINNGRMAFEEYTFDTWYIPGGNDTWYVPGGNDTDDKIFLLSFDEMIKYFPSRVDRAVFRSREEMHNPRSGWAWWLRSPGRDNFSGIRIVLFGYYYSGTVNGGGHGSANGVRPAMWLYT